LASKLKENISVHIYRNSSKLENFKVTTCSSKFNNKHMVQELERLPLPLVDSTKFRRKNEEYLGFSKFSFMGNTKWQLQVIGETRARE